LALRCYDCYGALRGGEGFFCVALDEGFEEGGFAYTWGADDGYEAWGRFFWDSIDLGDVEALFFDLGKRLEESQDINCVETYVVGSGSGFC